MLGRTCQVQPGAWAPAGRLFELRNKSSVLQTKQRIGNCAPLTRSPVLPWSQPEDVQGQAVQGCPAARTGFPLHRNSQGCQSRRTQFLLSLSPPARFSRHKSLPQSLSSQEEQKLLHSLCTAPGCQRALQGGRAAAGPGASQKTWKSWRG